ncbi:MAG TPA: 2-oxoglutarate dehydrogenase complex dihydrolipoyllysine-residue succinyltransferase [Vicinamibacterales bacterium]|nr:2-oxoglutarate dehydrogenase complex dihydrolipoyllysine-residue succinyltransferase [Vicinamibacterales bacterium]
MPANVVVPEVGESIVDARVAKWLKKEGDAVNVGEPLVELETDKIDLEVAAPQAGVLKSIAHGDGADVKVGEVLGVIEEGSTSAAAPAPATVEKAAKADAKPAEPAQPEATKQRATPAARNAAQQNAVDLKQIPGSGDAGRVMKRDVEAAFAEATAPRAAFAEATAPKAASAEATAPKAASAEATAPRAATAEATAPRPVMKPAPRPAVPVREERRIEGDRTEERVRMSKRRATIAKRLVEAQSTAAMLTTFNEVDMSAVMAIRERHKQAFKDRHGVGLGLTSFFVRGSIGALREFPRINAEIQGDEMVLKHYYDIGIAVGASEGLVVPVLRDADRMSFAQVEQKVRQFAKAAEDGTLSLADLKGGTFTITNGGVFGSLLSTPILNPPQVAILGLHAIKDRPMAVGGQVVIRPMMYMALTYDHRIVDGAEAVQFLVRVRQLVEDPGALLLE